MRRNACPQFIGPWQTPTPAPARLKLANYYAGTPSVVFDRKLTRSDMAQLSFENLPLAASSKTSVSKRSLGRMQQAIGQMTAGKWASVYVPTKPGDGNNSGNGMTGIFLQRADLEVSVGLTKTGSLKTEYHWPHIKRYTTHYRVQPQHYNYSLVYHYYKSAFESAFDLMIQSTINLDNRLKSVMLDRSRLGLYFGVTDYYGDPNLLPSHLRKQAIDNNPNPREVGKAEYLDFLSNYKKMPILPGNYHTDGIEKKLDVQGIFTVLNRGATGGETLIRRRGIRRYQNQYPPKKEQADVTVRLRTPEGHCGLWVPSWGRTEIEHTPGPIQGGHRTIIVFGLDSIDPDLDIKESDTRKYYGSHFETRTWDKRRWFRGGKSIAIPDNRLWNAK